MLAPTPVGARGHANLGIDGVEERVYDGGAPRASGRFLSAAGKEDRRLVSAGRRAAAEVTARREASWAVKRRGKGGDTYRGKHFQALMDSYRQERARGRNGRGGGGGEEEEEQPRAATARQARTLKRRDHGGQQQLGVEPWMLDSVWMQRPVTDNALRIAVDLRRNYGSSRQQSRASSRSARGIGRGNFVGVGRDGEIGSFRFVPN